MSRPSTSHQHPPLTNGHKRAAPSFDEGRYQDPSFVTLPSMDQNAWYYPSQGYDSEEDDLRFSAPKGNWGRKTVKDARWVRRGKMTTWAPGQEDWEMESRARQRLKLMLPPHIKESTTVELPHLRSPSPPLVSPYPMPNQQHVTYTSFVMDKSVTHTYRSQILDELEHATNGLIEGETTLRRALGRLWRVMGDDPDKCDDGASLVPKREDEEVDEEDERERILARAPDLQPITHKIFLSSDPAPFEMSQFANSGFQMESLEKSLIALRDLQDDGREYIERLEEIREGLGEVRTQRNSVWDLIRQKAVKELQDVASASAL